MDCLTRELRPIPFDVTVYTDDEVVFWWEQQWHPCTGVPTVDFNLDVRDLVLGANAAIDIKPALQFAPTRTDRPGVGAVITAGSGATAVGATHYRETLSAAAQMFFRRGVGAKLTTSNGVFARAQVLMYTAFRTLGMTMAPEEIVFNPLNDTDAPSMFQLGGGKAIPTLGVDKAKVALNFMGILNASMEWQIAVRAFNDPLARGDWTLIHSWQALLSGNVAINSGEVAFTGLTLSDFQWLDLALALRKATTGSANSRCIVNVIPALKYT